MDSANSEQLSVKRRLLKTAEELEDKEGTSMDALGGTAKRSLPGMSEGREPSSAPQTLLDIKEEKLLFKAEKDVSGRRVLITFYNETTAEDIVNFSHNIRVVVACVQTLSVLITQDYHEDVLEQICMRRNKRHLMSATCERELVQELWNCLALQHSGQRITGISFAGMES